MKNCSYVRIIQKTRKIIEIKFKYLFINFIVIRTYFSEYKYEFSKKKSPFIVMNVKNLLFELSDRISYRKRQKTNNCHVITIEV